MNLRQVWPARRLVANGRNVSLHQALVPHLVFPLVVRPIIEFDYRDNPTRCIANQEIDAVLGYTEKIGVLRFGITI